MLLGCPRRVRVAERVYQCVDRHTGKPVAGKYEFSYRDATGRQVWQTAKGSTRADAGAERAELLARMHQWRASRRTTLTVSEVAQLWLERASGPQGQWADSTRALRPDRPSAHRRFSRCEHAADRKLQAA